MSDNMNNLKAKQEARRQQEDAALNRILIWFGAAVVVEFILLMIARAVSSSVVLQYLTILVPVIAVLAVIYYLFQHDFFCISTVSACGILCLQLYRKSFMAHPMRITCGFVLGLVLLVVAVVALILLQKGKLTGKLGKLLCTLVPEEANFPLLYVTCALVAAMLVLVLVLGSIVAYYLLFVLIGWLFIMAVYYVVKLM